MDNTDSSSDEQTPLTNSPDDNSKSHIELPGPIKSRRSNKIVLFVVAVVLIAAGGAGYFFWHKSTGKNQAKNTTQSNTIASKGVTFSPRFSTVNGYATFKGSEWYAVSGGVVKVPANGAASFYTDREGVPSGTPTGLAVHDDKLWLSTQDGVASLKDDGSGFDEVSVVGKMSTSAQTVLNGKIYQDTLANKLYLNDFKNFYTLNDSTATWEAVSGSNTTLPTDISTFAANKDFVVVTAHANSNGTPVWIYNKKNATWKVIQLPALESTYTISAFVIDDQIFLIGRSKGYEGCANTVSTMSGTSAYRLDANGSWQPLTEFNKDTKRPDLVLVHHVKDPTINVYSRTCDGGNSTKYTVHFANNTLMLSDPTSLSRDLTVFEGSDEERQTLVDAVAKATGLYPVMRVLAVDKQGNLIYSYSKSANSISGSIDEGLAIAKGTDIHSSTELTVPERKDYDTVRPIMCDGNFSYLFVGAQEGSEGGPTGNWAKSKILKMDGISMTDFVDLKNEVSFADFACSNNKITWLGKQFAQQLDLTTKQFKAVGSKIGIDLTNYSGSFYPLDNGNGWALSRAVDDKQNSTWALYYIDSTKNTADKIVSKITGSQVSISSATPSNAWIVSNGSDSGHQKLTVYDAKGSATFSKEYVRPVVSLATGLTHSILLTGVNPSETVFRRFTASTLALDGKQTPLPGDKIAIHSLYEYNDSHAVIDTTRKLIWFTDSEFGLFTIPLE